MLKKVQTGISVTNMSQIIEFSDLKLAKLKSSKHRVAIVMHWDLLVSQETMCPTLLILFLIQFLKHKIYIKLASTVIVFVD